MEWPLCGSQRQLISQQRLTAPAASASITKIAVDAIFMV
jgi:hypothetical protein